MTSLTIGMATYDDYDGVYFSIQALRMYQDMHNVQIIVTDNFGCDFTRQFIEETIPRGKDGKPRARYIRFDRTVGTAAPRDAIFQAAETDAVAIMDCHVFLEPGVVRRLKRYYDEHPASLDLLQGPMVAESLDAVSTHFNPTWSDHMWGQWGDDPRGNDPGGEPFDIPMQGLGFFSCRKDAWLGFNDRFKGFGGEEGYIHEKFRQAGRRCLCLPWLRWMHRFGRPYSVPFPLNIEDKLFNYLVGHSEIGLDLRPIFDHFRQYMDDGAILAVAAEALGSGDHTRYLENKS